MTAFIRQVETALDLEISGYEDLYRFSIDRPADFWREVWSFSGIRGEMGERVIVDLDRMPGARFFPDARLNFADNLLRRRDCAPAIIFNGEGRGRTLNHAELYAEVARFAVDDERVGQATCLRALAAVGRATAPSFGRQALAAPRDAQRAVHEHFELDRCGGAICADLFDR